MEVEGLFRTNLTVVNLTAAIAGGPAVCPGTPIQVTSVPTQTQLGYAVRYEFLTELLTLGEVNQAVHNMRDTAGAAFSSAAVAALNVNATASTLALRVTLDAAVTAVLYVADVRVYTPQGTTMSEATGSYVPILQHAIETGGVSAGLRIFSLPAAAAFDYVCSGGGACNYRSHVQLALPPPSPPPPAAARSVAAMRIGGYTALTFGDAQRRAFVRAVARVAGVDPASVVILEVADDATAGNSGKKRLLQAGGAGVSVRFAVDSTGGAQADQAQARITNAEQTGVLVDDLKAEPALAAVTTAGGVTGSFEIITPPMPPPAMVAPSPPGGPTCAGVVERQTSSGMLTDGSTAARFYTDALDCTWILGDGTHEYVSIRFTRFMTEFDEDFVEVFDGRGTDSPSLGRFSGNGGSVRTNGPPLSNDGMAITSTTPFITVRFSTDSTTQERGFALGWTSGRTSSSPPPPTPLGRGSTNATAPLLSTPKDHCQEPVLVTGTTGVVSDGSLPNVEYLPNSVCIYLIRSSLQRVKLTFSRFDLEQDYDFLNVYSAEHFDDVEGLSTTSAAQALFSDAHKIADLTGGTSPLTFISSSKTLALVFRSDSSVQGLGFAATWESTDETPQRPAAEQSNDANGPCVGEGVILRAESGVVTDGPGSYADSARCTWTIVPSDGAHAIRLEFTAFDMEENYDYVKIFSKPADGSEVLQPIAELTGSAIPSTIYVNGGDALVVKLISDGSVHQTGFNATFRAATASEVDASKAGEHTCFDGVQNGDETGVDCGGACDPCGGSCSGTLLINATTPGAPTNGVFTDGSNASLNYHNNRRCNFVIKAPADKLVAVSFNRLSMEDGYDFVYAFDNGYDGTASTRVELGEFTGAYSAQRRNNIGEDGAGYLLSSGPGLFLRLESDSSVASTGFEAAWSLRDNPDVDLLTINQPDVSTASTTYAVIGLVVVLVCISTIAALAQLRHARKNNRMNKQIIAHTATSKSKGLLLEDNIHLLKDDDIESFPLSDEGLLKDDDIESFPLSDEGTPNPLYDTANETTVAALNGAELEEIKVSTDAKPRGIMCPTQ